MRSNITDRFPGDVLSEIKMARAGRRCITYMLVEGESDVKFFYNIVDKRKCTITNLNGKENVLKTVKKVNENNIQGVFGIVDSDFDHLLKRINTISNICTTDVHDLETQSLCSGTFERFNNEYGDIEKQDKFERQNKLSVFDHIISTARKIGVVRFINIKNEYHMDFSYVHENNGLDRYIDKRSFSFDYDSYIEDIANTTRGVVSKEALQKEVELELDHNYNTWQICRGHDITSLISIYYGNQRGFNKGVGNSSAINIKEKDIERALRISYAIADFERTQMFRYIKTWQRNNERWVFLQKKYLIM